MERRELGVYAAADATVTVSAHDSAWVRHRLRAAAGSSWAGGGGGTASSAVVASPRASAAAAAAAAAQKHAPLVRTLPFIAHPPPPRAVAGYAHRSGLLYCGVAHTSAAESMRWFLTHVHPLIVPLMRERVGVRRLRGSISLGHASRLSRLALAPGLACRLFCLALTHYNNKTSTSSPRRPLLLLLLRALHAGADAHGSPPARSAHRSPTRSPNRASPSSAGAGRTSRALAPAARRATTCAAAARAASAPSWATTSCPPPI